MLLSQAPGVGGGERVVIPALARASSLEVVLAGHAPVCRMAEEAGLQTVELELPFAHRLTHLGVVAGGSLKVARLARRLGAHLVYANGTRAMPYAAGARALGGPRFVAHHHGLFTTGPFRALVFGVERLAEAIVVPSRAVAAPFPGRHKVRVIPNGIDLEHFRPTDDPAGPRRALGLEEDALVVGTVTRADPRKGMETFVRTATRIAAETSGVRFLIGGGATFPHEQEAYERTRRGAVSALGERVVLTGRLDDPLPAFQAMDVFVHVGDPEGFSLTTLEALACAVPVVAYRWGGVAEILEHGRTGLLVDPGDEGAAAEAVRRLAGDSELRRNLGRRGREVCEERYGIERFSRELGDLLLSVIGT